MILRGVEKNGAGAGKQQGTFGPAASFYIYTKKGDTMKMIRGLNGIFVGLMVLFLVCPVTGKQVARLEEPLRVDMMTADSQFLYVLDDFKVHKYRLENFQYVGGFGKKGKGPGEFSPNFLNRLILQLDGEKVVLNQWNKIAWFSRDGRLLKEKVIPFLSAQVVPLGRNYVLTKYIRGKNGINQLAVQICDPDFKTLKTLYAREDIVPARSGKLDCPNEQIFIVKTDKNIYTYDQRPGTMVYLYDYQGNRLKSIKLQLKPIKMPQRFKDDVLGWMEGNTARIRSFSQMARLTIEQIRQMVYYHEKLPVARNFTVQKGEIFIETYQKRGNKSRFVFLNQAGQAKRDLYLIDAEPGRVKMSPHTTYCVANNKYYYLKENLDEEIWELHVESLVN